MEKSPHATSLTHTPRAACRPPGLAGRSPDIGDRTASGLIRLAAGALALAFLAGGAAQAATFGHARLASDAGQPLLILVPVSGLTDADLKALSARPAPAADWVQAGLTPPVPLESLSVSVGADVRPGGRRVLRVGSGQAFTGNLADLLLDVRTATGEQRYQVSLVAPGPARAAASSNAAQAAEQGGSATVLGTSAPHTSTRRVPTGAIAVRRGDTMFAISRRHAVDGVSIYQLMMALQRANPQAFIHDNVNLVRAGASLAVPDINDMLSISDAEARRQFQAQAAAFARMRGRLAGAASSADAGQAAAGAVSPAESREAGRPAGSAGDHLRLSESGHKGADTAADARAARGHALKDAESRVEELQGNVQNLNQALQSQGEAARSAAAQGAEAIGHSIQQIASAISEASQEAAAQANEETGSGGKTGASSKTDTAGAPAPHAGSGAAPANGGAGSGSAASAAAGATPAAAGDAGPAIPPTAELQPSEHAQNRASWLQDHLLGVMTGLLALIVFIIAWLLRRANAARDEADAAPRVTESMVSERLQDIDLNLEPGESRPPQR